MTIEYNTQNSAFLAEIISVGKPINTVRLDEAEGDAGLSLGDHVIHTNTTVHGNNVYVSNHLRGKRTYSPHPPQGSDSYDADKPGRHMYGTVARVTSQHAHVKWEDGTETKNRLSNGTDVSDERHALKIPSTPEEHHAAHVESHKTKAASNVAMKEKFAKQREDDQVRFAARDRIRHVSNRINYHGNQLSVEHAEAIHRILDEAGVTRDKDGDEAHSHLNNKHYGVDPKKSPENLHGEWMKRRFEDHSKENA